MTTNVAAQANGGVASASSEYNYGTYPASNANSGSRVPTKGGGWGGTPPSGGWNDDTSGTWPDTLDITFDNTYSINEINVITLKDAYTNSTPPTLSDTFASYGATDYLVQYWNGSSWVTLFTVTGNNKVWRKFTFAPVSTTKIRISISASAGSNDFSRLVEVEAWTADLASTTAFQNVASRFLLVTSSSPRVPWQPKRHRKLLPEERLTQWI